MKRQFATILGLAGIGLFTGLGVIGAMRIVADAAPLPRAPQLADAAPARALATPAPTAALPTVSPTPIAAPAVPSPTPATVAPRTVVVAAVKPAVRADVPAICQTQTYSAERERRCPTAAPAQQLSLSELTQPVPTPKPTVAPAPALPSPSATPQATAVPAATVAPTPTPTQAPSPAATPAPTPVPLDDCGGYPANLCRAAIDTLVDPWGMYNRECVSYAAYKVYASGRKMPYWGGKGNAIQWPANARAAGIPTDGAPRVGDVAVYAGNQYGHAMYVEAVLEGGKIYVSQYNYDLKGKYSTMIVPVAGLTFIHF